MLVPYSVDVRPSPDGGRLVEVTLELSARQLAAGAHAAGRLLQERYRVPVLDSTEEILAMRELNRLADELAAPAGTGARVRLTLTVARLGRLREALEAFAAGRADGVLLEDDVRMLPDVHGMLDPLADAHQAAIRAALGAAVPHP